MYSNTAQLSLRIEYLLRYILFRLGTDYLVVSARAVSRCFLNTWCRHCLGPKLGSSSMTGGGGAIHG